MTHMYEPDVIHYHGDYITKVIVICILCLVGSSITKPAWNRSLRLCSCYARMLVIWILFLSVIYIMTTTELPNIGLIECMHY